MPLPGAAVKVPCRCLDEQEEEKYAVLPGKGLNGGLLAQGLHVCSDKREAEQLLGQIIELLLRA